MILQEIIKTKPQVYVDISHPNYQNFIDDLTEAGFMWASGDEPGNLNYDHSYYLLGYFKPKIMTRASEKAIDKKVITLDEYESKQTTEVDLDAFI